MQGILVLSCFCWREGGEEKQIEFVILDERWFHAFFKATSLYLRVAVETNISGEGRKERRRKRVQWDLFFPFSFLYKSVKTTMKKGFF